MATVIETQAYLDETKTPGTMTPALAKAALVSFLPKGSKIVRQAAVWRELAELAELSETDAELVGKFEAIIDNAKTFERLMNDIRRHMRDLVITYRVRQEQDDDFRAMAATKGYNT